MRILIRLFEVFALTFIMVVTMKTMRLMWLFCWTFIIDNLSVISAEWHRNQYFRCAHVIFGLNHTLHLLMWKVVASFICCYHSTLGCYFRTQLLYDFCMIFLSSLYQFLPLIYSKYLNDNYETRVLQTGNIDERIFIKEDSVSHIGTPTKRLTAFTDVNEKER